MSDYHNYYLRDNPFHSNATFNPRSDDIRINGSIYNPNIMAEVIQSFQHKVQRRLSIIYVENTGVEWGVGKSALTAHQCQKLEEQEGITSIYIRSDIKSKPTDFAFHLISRWHQEGHLWPTVLQTLAAYAVENPRGEIPPAGVERFAETFPRLPSRVISLSYFNVFNSDQLITDLAAWAHRQVGDSLPLDLAHIFFQSYLTDPRTFLDTYPKVLRRYKWDYITMLAAVYRLLKLGGHKFHYLFFDQFEEVVHVLRGKSLSAFSVGMRRLVEASSGQATLIVTLHPGATRALDSPEGGDIRSIAPLDQRHVVNVRPLTRDEACVLAQTYLDHFRLDDTPPPDILYPFTTEAIGEIYHASDGVIRKCLKAFHWAIEEGAKVGFPVIDRGFLDEHPEAITGRVYDDTL